MKGDVKERLERELGNDARLNEIPDTNCSTVVYGCIAALTFQIEQRSRGGTGINIKDNFKIKSSKEKGAVNIEYGAFCMDDVDSHYVQTVKDILTGWESKVKEWEEYAALEKLFEKLTKTKSKLQDELAVITIRRVVPGRCKYCPI
ncbi:hypothetical protein ACFLVS_00935 [Chloroflexota bacterium]